jgi:CheY-like chemotaxis protein
MKILIVDDDPNIRELVDYNFRLDGHEVLFASSAQEGILTAQSEVPHLILLDVMMPGMDGLEALPILKRDPRTAEIPVFMLTAKGRMGDVERAFTAGANDYITKPFDPAKLSQMVTLKLGQKAGRQPSGEGSGPGIGTGLGGARSGTAR